MATEIELKPGTRTEVIGQIDKAVLVVEGKVESVEVTPLSAVPSLRETVDHFYYGRPYHGRTYYSRKCRRFA